MEQYSLVQQLVHIIDIILYSSLYKYYIYYCLVTCYSKIHVFSCERFVKFMYCNEYVCVLYMCVKLCSLHTVSLLSFVFIHWFYLICLLYVSNCVCLITYSRWCSAITRTLISRYWMSRKSMPRKHTLFTIVLLIIHNSEDNFKIIQRINAIEWLRSRRQVEYSTQRWGSQ